MTQDDLKSFATLLKEFSDVVTAHSEGKTIQFRARSPLGVWIDLENKNPDFENYKLFEYRVKPDQVFVSGWVNVYDWGLSQSFGSKEVADRMADHTRIDCLCVSYVSGEEGGEIKRV